MQAARRRAAFDFTSRLGRRAEAGPRRVLPRVRPPSSPRPTATGKQLDCYLMDIERNSQVLPQNDVDVVLVFTGPYSAYLESRPAHSKTIKPLASSISAVNHGNVGDTAMWGYVACNAYRPVTNSAGLSSTQ